jgi:hypothetical protein
MAFVFERLDVRSEDWSAKTGTKENGTIFQTPAWLSFLSGTQYGEPVVAALTERGRTIGYFTGVIVRKFGLLILGSPFPGWSTDYMGLILSAEVDRRQAVQALIQFAFLKLGCVHLEMMDRNLTFRDLDGLDVQHRVYRSFEIDLTRSEDELFSNMTSACRRCVRKAKKEGVFVEEARDMGFADEYFVQLQDVFAKQGLVPTYGIERVRNLIRQIHPMGQLLLLRARDRSGRCIATGIFPNMNGVMYFWGGASWRQHQILRPNEAIQWSAMKIGKQKGLRTYDMGGGGEYKRKYGGKEIAVPWIRKSKYLWVGYLRDMAQRGYTLRQRSLGRFNSLLDAMDFDKARRRASRNAQGV